tara:strand:+ start:4539 stop:5666 length:1128 start_codon:yes stop_codon:yes gene_type:complete
MLKHNTLTIISDTAIAKRNGESVILEAPLREIEYLSEEYEEIFWLGYSKNYNDSMRAPLASNIRLISLPQSGGRTFLKKIPIIFYMPLYLFRIFSYLKKSDVIHMRAPSVPAVLGMFCLYFLPAKKGWIKYAGTWIDKTAFTYNLQRKWLSSYNHLPATILGEFNNQKPNHYSLYNPVYTRMTLENNLNSARLKSFDNKLNIIFIGSLDSNKQPDLLLRIIINFKNNNRLGDVYFIGDGPLKSTLKNMVENEKVNNIFITGFKTREFINNIYELAHLIVLPSKSEGFPKVIAEATSFGVIPIVSDISCINQIYKDKESAFLLNNNNIELSLSTTLRSILSGKIDLLQVSQKVKDECFRFTYEIYKTSIRKIISKN